MPNEQASAGTGLFLNIRVHTAVISVSHREILPTKNNSFLVVKMWLTIYNASVM